MLQQQDITSNNKLSAETRRATLSRHNEMLCIPSFRVAFTQYINVHICIKEIHQRRERNSFSCIHSHIVLVAKHKNKYGFV